MLVLALPRGGVPVAFEVARAIRAPLDVSLVRRLGVSVAAVAPNGPLMARLYTAAMRFSS